MTTERKAPKDWKTWADFANCYDLVLFNECVNLGNHEVSEEWYENHVCSKENEDDDCPDEAYQWYAIAISDDETEWLNKHFSLDIFYSDVLQLYILPVYHFGTSWDYVSLSMNNEVETI